MRKLFRCFKAKDGTTMIEVLVAVIVVLLVTATFSHIISVSTKLFGASMDIIDETEEFNRDYYKTANYEARTYTAGRLSLVVDMDKTKDATASGKTLALNENSGIVYWAEPGGYDMYAVSVGKYANHGAPVSTQKPEATIPPAGNSIESPAPSPSSSPTPTPKPGATGSGVYIEVKVNGEKEKIYEYNDWDTVIKDEMDKAEAAGEQNFTYIMDEGHVYILVNEDGTKEAYVCIWNDWKLTINVGDTRENVIKNNPGAFVKFTEDEKVFTYDDIRQYYENNGNIKTFSDKDEERPKKGELFWDGSEYHLARQDIGPYDTDLTLNHWMTLKQPTVLSD